MPVVDDGVAFVLFWESHFLHRIIGKFVGSSVVHLVHFHPLCLVGIVLIVEMELRQPASRFGEGNELFGAFHDRNAGEGFAEVVGKSFAIVTTMQQTIDIIEDVFFGDAFRSRKTAAHLL